MMDLVAKKYTKAILGSFSTQEIEEVITLLSMLSKTFEDKAVRDFIHSPFIEKGKKEELLLSVFGKCEVKFENLIKLLVRSDRISAIPSIIKTLEKNILADKKQYVAVLRIKEELQEKAAIDGIRLSVEDLGVEISFSKERFFTDLTNHILKAI